MAKLSKVDAAKAVGVSRQTLYMYIKDGRLSVDPDGLLDTAELLRAGFTFHETRRPVLDTSGHELTSHDTALDVYRDMLDMLKQQLRDAQAREHAAREEAREAYRSAQERETLLLRMLQEAQQRYDRLLEAPRPRPVPLGETPPTAKDERGLMRQLILVLLRDHPQGLTPGEIQRMLGVEK